MTKFEKLGLSKEVADILKKQGIKDPTEIQEKTIPLLLDGKDIIGGSATGSGKTLAFASPIIENLVPRKFVQALILTPTRELAEQVTESIKDFSKNKKLNILAVYGGVNIERQIRQLAITDVLVGTPGRILDHLGRGTLRLGGVKILVLDEVDRMFDMGFSRDVERIISECPKKRQTMMFSATISPDIDHLAKKYTIHPIEIAVESHIDPSKLKQVYYDVSTSEKFSLLVHLLKKEGSDFVLVFCSTRRNVDFVADNLIRNGIKAKAIHGGLDQKKRLRVLGEFKKKGTGVLVCTDVAARGLDIDAVSHVYNYDLPGDVKDYIHRIGRTARAGKNGIAINIVASRDYEKFGEIMSSDFLTITPEKIPSFERVMIKLDNKERSRGNFRGNSSRGNSRGSSRDNGRYNSRGNSSGRSSRGTTASPRGGYSRGGSSSSYSRDRPPRRESNTGSRSSPRRTSIRPGSRSDNPRRSNRDSQYNRKPRK